MSRIIVGVDGSEQSTEALRWALAHAKSGDEIVATHAWQIPPVSGFEFPAYNLADVETHAGEMVDKVLASIGTDDHPGVTISKVIRQGHSGQVLIDQSEGADMIIVGSRGHGGFRGLLLGSVSTYVVHHAKTAVVVLPHRE